MSRALNSEIRLTVDQSTSVANGSKKITPRQAFQSILSSWRNVFASEFSIRISRLRYLVFKDSSWRQLSALLSTK